MLSMYKRQYVLIKQPSASLTLKYGNAQMFFCERKTQIWSMKQTDGDLLDKTKVTQNNIPSTKY